MKNSRELVLVKEYEYCPIKKSMSIIGGKWKIFIIWILLQNEDVRYGELKKNISGITDMMLSQCLKELERDNVISRKQYNEVPLRVEYSLTDNGKKLSNVMEELSLWGRIQ
ncbi:helix-turn-helix domain-containing protein [uncultured Clostridium sp.]|uniref:winged helix-turn-helix transcriptional regulator n=1 Tax=uncultured Clostridium sp. TaxID=59620 RepID=UPI0026182BEF|nr:helix-turn-helix domain-containing protein [uncultured Clostridium sp.]